MMPTRRVAFAAFLAFAASSSLAGAAEQKFQRSFTVNGAVALDVCTREGSVHVTAAPGTNVEISGKVHSSSWHALGESEEMKKIAANPPVQRTGNAIHIGNHDICGGRGPQNVAIDYEVTVPRNTTVVATDGSGNITVEGVSGSLRAQAGSGNIRATGIGANSILQSGSGTVDVQNAHGDLKVQTASGDISVRDSELTQARLGAASGGITTSNVRGGLRVETASGDLTIGGTPLSDWKLGSASGSIRLHPDPTAKFTLDAESGSGNIASKIPVANSGQPIHGVLRGSVNGGGPVVKMYTASGNITIE